MKVIAHRDRCMGHTQCVIAAPEVFDLDDEGYVVVLQDEPDTSLLDATREAVMRCPERALELTD